jgi:hypothetical protein
VTHCGVIVAGGANRWEGAQRFGKLSWLAGLVRFTPVEDTAAPVASASSVKEQTPYDQLRFTVTAFSDHSEHTIQTALCD